VFPREDNEAGEQQNLIIGHHQVNSQCLNFELFQNRAQGTKHINSYEFRLNS
jgi:hypothetical protein